MDSLTRQQESFAILLDTEAPDGLLVTTTAQAADKFGWTAFTAMARNHTSQNVNKATGAVTTVHTVTMFSSHVSQTRLKQLLWLEEKVRGLDDLKCFMLISGEPCVMMDSLTQRQELFATLLVSDMSEERWTLAATVWATD